MRVGAHEVGAPPPDRDDIWTQLLELCLRVRGWIWFISHCAIEFADDLHVNVKRTRINACEKEEEEANFC